MDDRRRAGVLLNAVRLVTNRGAAHSALQREIDLIEDLGGRVISREELMTQPIVAQVWRGLSTTERMRLIMLLNLTHRPISPGDLFDSHEAELRAAFESWGIKLLTSDQEKAIPRRRGRKPPELMPIPSIYHYRYEFLVQALLAYLVGDPQIKTKTLSRQDLSPEQCLNEFFSEMCQTDFRWACVGLNRSINKKYAESLSLRFSRS